MFHVERPALIDRPGWDQAGGIVARSEVKMPPDKATRSALGFGWSVPLVQYWPQLHAFAPGAHRSATSNRQPRTRGPLPTPQPVDPPSCNSCDDGAIAAMTSAPRSTRSNRHNKGGSEWRRAAFCGYAYSRDLAAWGLRVELGGVGPSLRRPGRRGQPLSLTPRYHCRCFTCNVSNATPPYVANSV